MTQDSTVAPHAATAASATLAPSMPLDPALVPVGEPLPWDVEDADGTVLLDQGTVLHDPDAVAFLFQAFRPCYRPPADDGAASLQDAPGNSSLNVEDMRLSIGMMLGIKPQSAVSGKMSPSRLIGRSPQQALFVTPPLVDGRYLPLEVNQNVDLVAVSSQGVFRFVCTVQAVCKKPFDYLVLSAPGPIQLLRERKSPRVGARLAVRFKSIAGDDRYDGLGVARDMSVLGMSLAAARAIWPVGERVQIAFRLKSAAVNTDIEVAAVVRNVVPASTSESLVVHGLEFVEVSAAQKLSLTAFVFDSQHVAFR